MKKLLLAIAFILAFARDGTAQVTPGGGGGTTITGTGCVTSGSSILKGDGATGCTNATSGVDYLATGSITSAGLTQATAKILGRTTASTGAIEELTVGAGLTLGASSLIVGAGQITNAMLAGSITAANLLGSIPASKLVLTDITTLGTVTTGGLGSGAVVRGVTMTLGSDGTGDIYYRNSSGVLTRLNIGSVGQVLTVAGGLPSWAASAGGGGSGNPGGSATQCQYNVGGKTFGGIVNCTSDGTTITLTSPVLVDGLYDTGGNKVIGVDGAGNLVLGTGLSQFTYDVSALTALRQVKIPNQNSITVVPNAGASNQFVTALSSTTGILSLAQVNFTNLAGNIAMSQINGGVNANALTYVSGDGTFKTPPGLISGLTTGAYPYATSPTALADGTWKECGAGVVAAGASCSSPTTSDGIIYIGSLGLVDTSAAHNVTIGATSSVTLTADRTVTVDVQNANRILALRIARGAKDLATSAISSATCTTAQTDTATGTLSTDAIVVSFNGDPTAVTGYVPLTAGMLTIIPYPTADTVNFKVCNNTSGSITPGAIRLNWEVVR